MLGVSRRVVVLVVVSGGDVKEVDWFEACGKSICFARIVACASLPYPYSPLLPRLWTGCVRLWRTTGRAASVPSARTTRRW